MRPAPCLCAPGSRSGLTLWLVAPRTGDQRKRIEELNEGRGKPKPKRKRNDPAAHESPHTLPFERCFWHDLPAPAPTWREQITGEERVPALKAIRKSLSIVVKGDCPPPIASASDPHLPPSFGALFAALHFTEPSRVQRQCWPAALTGADVLGIAPTGSGKTIAYLLPSVPHINAQLDTHGPLRASEGVPKPPRCSAVCAFSAPLSFRLKERLPPLCGCQVQSRW
jgi:hypothetical protein